MIDRLIAYSGARKQSRQFAPAVAGALREGKLDEAIKIADRYNKSHLAKVVVAGLQEFRAHQMSSDISGEEIEASKRALERAEAIVHAELKRGVSSLATIGSTGSLRRTVRNGRRHHQRVQGHFDRKVDRVWARSPAVFRKRWSPPPSVCSWLSRRSGCTTTSRASIEAFDVEMGNSSSELIDYFLKRTQKASAGK